MKEYCDVFLILLMRKCARELRSLSFLGSFLNENSVPSVSR